MQTVDAEHADSASKLVEVEEAASPEAEPEAAVAQEAAEPEAIDSEEQAAPEDDKQVQEMNQAVVAADEKNN